MLASFALSRVQSWLIALNSRWHYSTGVKPNMPPALLLNSTTDKGIQHNPVDDFCRRPQKILLFEGKYQKL